MSFSPPRSRFVEHSTNQEAGSLFDRRLTSAGPPRAEPLSERSYKRAVRERDGDQCTFVSESGHRCQETAFLEYDHIVPVAKGGQSTVDNLRMRCATHNRHTARKQGLVWSGARERPATYVTRPGARGQFE